VPPPISTTIEPIGSVTGMSAPIAAAIGSSISHTWRRAGIARGVADRAALDRGRTRGHADHDLRPAHEAPLLAAMHLVDEMLDHLLGDIDVGDHAVAKGRIAWMLSGVLPIISLASSPTALHRLTPLIVSTATTDGSLSTMPRPRR
jgi:hypothetical protein